MARQNDLNIAEWYWDIPPVTRGYFTLSFLLTAATALDLVSPFSLYLNLQLVLDKGEVCTAAVPLPVAVSACNLGQRGLRCCCRSRNCRAGCECTDRCGVC